MKKILTLAALLVAFIYMMPSAMAQQITTGQVSVYTTFSNPGGYGGYYVWMADGNACGQFETDDNYGVFNAQGAAAFYNRAQGFALTIYTDGTALWSGMWRCNNLTAYQNQ